MELLTDNRNLRDISPASSQLPTPPSRTSQTTIELHRRFGTTPETLMAQFNPGLQIQYCRDVDRVHFGKAPRIGEIITVYGRDTAESWLAIQLNDLSEFAGCKDKLTVRQIQDTAAMIVESYPHYNLTEFMLFCQRFKRCKYGRFYGSVDPMIILQALSVFDEERRRAYDEREEREREKEIAENNRAAEELKQRYINRVPNAFKSTAPISFIQYRLMGFDSMTDDELHREIEEITSGDKKIPADVGQILQTIKQSFNINDK